jgi:hypothetical protein
MLAALSGLLITIHVIGAALGAAGVTYAEIFYTKATADGHIDRREYDYFSTTFWALRWGMTVVLVSGIALVIVQYLLPNSPEDVFYAPLWTQNTLALVITLAAWFTSRKMFPWWLGSSLAFAGWWMMLVLDGARNATFSYLHLLMVYVLLVCASAVFWGYVRVIAHKDSRKSS